MMPRVAPVISAPSNCSGCQPVHRCSRTSRSPSPRRRATASISVKAMSAVVSVSTPGVFVTGIFRVVAAATSMLLKPTPKFATTFKPWQLSSSSASTPSRMLQSSASRPFKPAMISALVATRSSECQTRSVSRSRRSITAGGIRRVRKTFGFMRRSKCQSRPAFAELAFGGGNHHGGIFAGQRFDFKGIIAARRAVRLEVADLEKYTEELDNFRNVVCAAGIAEARVLIAPRGIVAVFETGVADVDVRDMLPHGQQCLRRRFAQERNVTQVHHQAKVFARTFHAHGNFKRSVRRTDEGFLVNVAVEDFEDDVAPVIGCIPAKFDE